MDMPILPKIRAIWIRSRCGCPASTSKSSPSFSCLFCGGFGVLVSLGASRAGLAVEVLVQGKECQVYDKSMLSACQVPAKCMPSARQHLPSVIHFVSSQVTQRRLRKKSFQCFEEPDDCSSQHGCSRGKLFTQYLDFCYQTPQSSANSNITEKDKNINPTQHSSNTY